MKKLFIVAIVAGFMSACAPTSNTTSSLVPLMVLRRQIAIHQKLWVPAQPEPLIVIPEQQVPELLTALHQLIPNPLPVIASQLPAAI